MKILIDTKFGKIVVQAKHGSERFPERNESPRSKLLGIEDFT